MSLSTALLAIALVSAIWGIVDSILITVALDRRNIPVNMLLFRLYFFRYLNQYKKATLKETGRVGSLYYSFIIAMNIALVCGVAGLILRST